MKELTIPEIEKKYKDEWLLFEVKEEDKICNPIRGECWLTAQVDQQFMR